MPEITKNCGSGFFFRLVNRTLETKELERPFILAITFIMSWDIKVRTGNLPYFPRGAGCAQANRVIFVRRRMKFRFNHIY